MAFSDYKDTIILGVFFAILVGVVIAIALLGRIGSIDDANEKRKNIAIITGSVLGGVLLYTLLIFVYFSANPAYTNTYLIGASSVSIALSIIAVSIASMAGLYVP